MMSMNFSDIAILNIKCSDAKCQFDAIKRNTVKHKSLLPHVKMGKGILTLGDNEIGKNKFYCYESPISLKDVGRS